LDTENKWARLVAQASRPGAAEDQAGLLHDAVELGRGIVPGGVGCSVTQMDLDGFSTPVASGDLAMELDLAQYQENRGPCVDAARHQQLLRLDVIGRSGYARFSQVAAQHGVVSSLSLPLGHSDKPSALNLYAADTAAFQDDRPLAVARLLARCVGSLLGSAEASAPKTDFAAPRVRQAWSRHDLVVTAQQVIAERDQVDQAAAYWTLTETSRRQNRSIADVAGAVVDASRP
jgi:hypothetical protein